MTIPQYIVLTSTLLAVAFICNLYRKLATERAKRIEAVRRLIETRGERNEWEETARKNLQWWIKASNLLAKGHREITTLHCQLDSMTYGDRHCPNNHRFYSGEGVTCPRCNALEVVTWNYPAWNGRQWVTSLGDRFTAFEGIKAEDLSAEWKVCAGCGKPVESSEWCVRISGYWHPQCMTDEAWSQAVP